MPSRLIVAYSLILLLVVCAAASVAYVRYHSDRRSYSRRLRRENKRYERIASERADKLSE